MSEIKSTRSSELISYGALSQEYARTKCGYALVTTTTARDAVIIAEQEAEERHEQEIKELIQSQARRVYMIQCDRADELQKLKDRAVEELCYTCNMNGTLDCGHKETCIRLKLFTQKLNEKQ